MRSNTIEKKLGALLLFGTLLAALIVLIGGILYLLHTGTQPMQFDLLQNAPKATGTIWRNAFSFTPLGIVQLGLLVLVATQLFRVASLFVYYSIIRDYWFMLFCGLVLLALIYSLF